jgi:hypothetical protein
MHPFIMAQALRPGFGAADQNSVGSQTYRIRYRDMPSIFTHLFSSFFDEFDRSWHLTSERGDCSDQSV